MCQPWKSRNCRIPSIEQASRRILPHGWIGRKRGLGSRKRRTNFGGRAEGSETGMMGCSVDSGSGNRKWLEHLDKLFEAVAGVALYMITSDLYWLRIIGIVNMVFAGHLCSHRFTYLY